MDTAVGKLVLTLSSLSGDMGTTEVLVLFVLNTEEFVLRDESEVFQHFISFCCHLRSLRCYILCLTILLRLALS